MEDKIKGRLEILKKSMDELKGRKEQLIATKKQVEKAIGEIEVAMVSRGGAIAELEKLFEKPKQPQQPQVVEVPKKKKVKKFKKPSEDGESAKK